MSKRDFTYNFDNNHIMQASQMRATIMALRDSLSKVIPQHSIRLKITTTSGHERYFHVNPTTIADLWAIFKDVEPDFSVEDSAGASVSAGAGASVAGAWGYLPINA